MKYYLIYWEGDGGDSESHSVFYSTLVIAENEETAWSKWLSKQTDPELNQAYYDILEMTPI